jgi:transcriptional regulator with XRE-family HTH domain
MTTTGEQVKAARELLGWTQEKLAGEAALSTRTVGDFEGSKSRPSARTINMLQRTLEAAGVEFVGRRAGVRLKAPP